MTTPPVWIRPPTQQPPSSPPEDSPSVPRHQHDGAAVFLWMEPGQCRAALFLPWGGLPAVGALNGTIGMEDSSSQSQSQYQHLGRDRSRSFAYHRRLPGWHWQWTPAQDPLVEAARAELLAEALVTALTPCSCSLELGLAAQPALLTRELAPLLERSLGRLTYSGAGMWVPVAEGWLREPFLRHYEAAWLEEARRFGEVLLPRGLTWSRSTEHLLQGKATVLNSSLVLSYDLWACPWFTDLSVNRPEGNSAILALNRACKGAWDAATPPYAPGTREGLRALRDGDRHVQAPVYRDVVLDFKAACSPLGILLRGGPPSS